MGSLYKLGGPYMGASVPIQVKEVSVWVLGSFYWCRGTPEWVQGSLYNIGGPCTGAEGVPGGEAVWPERESLCRCRGTLYSCRSCPYTHGGGLLYGFRGSLHRFGGGPCTVLGVPTQFGVPVWFGGGVFVGFGGPWMVSGCRPTVRGPHMEWVWVGRCAVWGSLYSWGESLCGSGSLYGFGGPCTVGVSQCGMGGIPARLGVPVFIWGGPVWFGVPVRFGGPCINLGGPCMVRSPVQFGGPIQFWGVPGSFGVRVPRPPPNPAVGEPSPPAGVAVAPRGGGLAGRGGSRLFRRRVVSAQRRRHSGSRSRERRGPARFVPAMWFIYALSWLSLLIQVAFVTLAIGERHRRGGWGGFGACGGAAARGLGPASGSSRGLSRYVVLCVGEGVAPGRGQLGILLGAISGPRVQHIPGA